MVNTGLIKQVKNCVGFIFTQDDQNKITPQGTGFFVTVPQEHNPQKAVGYFVTARHVLEDGSCNFVDRFVLRLNKIDGGCDYTVVYPNTWGLFTHQDKDADIAVIPFRPNEQLIDFLSIPSEIFATKEKMRELCISEGCDVFFTGLFSSYLGQQRNQPVIRFGKVSLIPDEKIEWKSHKDRPSKYLDLYLMECLSFAGNSGSPVFFGVKPAENVMSIGIGERIYLAGIIMGSFHNTEFFGYDTFMKQNVGITAVTPAYKLHEILFSQIAIEQRKNASD